MKFGIFYELSVPRPWTPEAEHKVYKNALEQVRLADQLGFHNVWAVEHHFLEEYSHCAAPEIFLTACAMQTERIRVGHGIVICVPEFNHPVRIAERAAVLDIVSDGRLEFGTGRSATWTELGGFRVDPDNTKKSWDEFVHCIPKMWTQERFSYDGRFFSMPSRAVLPKPYQKPHPPMWVAVSSPGTELDAADRGMGALGVSFSSFKEQERKVEEYRRRIRVCEPVGLTVNDQVATVNFLYCHEDGKAAYKTGMGMVRTFNYLAGQLDMAKEVYPSRFYPVAGLLSASRRQAESPSAEKEAPEGIGVGTPERLIRELKKWESCGVDRVNFVLNAAEEIPQAAVLDSLRLFAREVMPHFAEAEPAEAAVAGAATEPMPHFGTQDVPAAAATKPKLASLAPAGWKLGGAAMLQLTFEIEEAPADALIPPALHPSIPPYAAFNVMRVAESPVGPFCLAQLRVIARAGIRPRGYLISSFASTPEAATALASQWGFDAEVADVSLQGRHDRWVGRVESEGEVRLHIELEDPEPIAPGDVPLIANLHLARVDEGGGETSLIAQIDTGYEITRAERGRPELLDYDPVALRAGGLEPTDPMVAVALEADADFAPLRFVMDPEKPAVQGTRRLDA